MKRDESVRRMKLESTYEVRSARFVKDRVEDSKQIEYEASLDAVRQPGGLRC
jgi:hypothetical protein